MKATSLSTLSSTTCPLAYMVPSSPSTFFFRASSPSWSIGGWGVQPSLSTSIALWPSASQPTKRTQTTWGSAYAASAGSLSQAWRWCWLWMETGPRTATWWTFSTRWWAGQARLAAWCGKETTTVMGVEGEVSEVRGAVQRTWKRQRRCQGWSEVAAILALCRSGEGKGRWCTLPLKHWGTVWIMCR